jgi:hypothetical protein
MKPAIAAGLVSSPWEDEDLVAAVEALLKHRKSAARRKSVALWKSESLESLSEG